MMDQRRIDWSNAEVDSAGTLTVEISGEADDIWMEALIRTLEWMEGESREGRWGEVDYSPNTLRVEEVAEDSVVALRKFLDDALRHANKAAAEDRNSANAAEGSPSTHVGDEAARRMTDQFRRSDSS